MRDYHNRLLSSRPGPPQLRGERSLPVREWRSGWSLVSGVEWLEGSTALSCQRKMYGAISCQTALSCQRSTHTNTTINTTNRHYHYQPTTLPPPPPSPLPFPLPLPLPLPSSTNTITAATTTAATTTVHHHRHSLPCTAARAQCREDAAQVGRRCERGRPDGRDDRPLAGR